ncbi:MAG: hypothetical protein HY815_28870 [Candidatus Riflebacteria bacterium]|nr:hypothetical protein [Candidatus Riflebacteria bacterium]
MRSKAIIALKDDPSIDIEVPLRELSASPDTRARTLAIYTISTLGDRRFGALLEELCQDPNRSVAARAREARALFSSAVEALSARPVE